MRKPLVTQRLWSISERILAILSCLNCTLAAVCVRYVASIDIPLQKPEAKCDQYKNFIPCCLQNVLLSSECYFIPCCLQNVLLSSVCLAVFSLSSECLVVFRMLLHTLLSSECLVVFRMLLHTLLSSE